MGFGRGALRDWLVKKIYRHIPHAWITLSNEQAIHFREWSRVARPVFVLPNTVAADIEHAGHREVTLASRAISRPLRVLILGRLDAHQKSLDTLLNFLGFHVELSADFHFTFVGDGPFREQIEQRLSVFPALQKLMSLRNWSATLEVMREHDVLLLASRYEGVPLVILEAMALGLPVIASNLPGTRAMLDSDCLFPTGDYEQAMQLLHSIKQNDRRMAIIQCNRETFLANASGAAFARAVDALTDKLIHFTGSTPETDLHSNQQTDQSDDATVIRT
jgi:glycosyltransferase involved in cell wall biosynthesis